MPASDDERVVPLGGKVVAPEVAVLHVVEAATAGAGGWPFPLQLEHNHAAAGRRCSFLVKSLRIRPVL